MSSTPFQYKNDELFCESLMLRELAEEYGTPLFVYSEKGLRANIDALKQAASKSTAAWRVAYAIKANSNPELLKIIASEGLGASVVSGGELRAALRAGFDASGITFDGPGKTDDEIRLAIDSKIRAIVVESEQELERIADEAAERGIVVNVCIRVNPHIDAKTHPYISTGLLENKFGVDLEKAEAMIVGCDYPYVKVIGIHAHIGSQIKEIGPFKDSAASLSSFVRSLADDHNIHVSEIDLGGGIGVRYHGVVQSPALVDDRDDSEEQIPSFEEYFTILSEEFKDLDVELTVEPGRAIIANTCCLVSQVLYTKTNFVRTFVIADAGMNDLIRPSLYRSYHQIVPLHLDAGRPHITSSVVGPICETGDFMALDRTLSRLEPREYIGIMCAGAYGFALSSNYNLRPRAAEILVSKDSETIIRERQTVEDILS